MKLNDIPFTAVVWDNVPKTVHPGETGHATWQTIERGNVRVRLVEYSPGYLADHWCPRGHVIHILNGRMISELKDGTRTEMEAGMSYFMGDDQENPHRSSTETGVLLFIVD
jgi:hypothetical protein